MSRTYRNKKAAEKSFRGIRFKNELTANYFAVQEMIEEGFKPSNREKSYSNPTGENTRSNWDDIWISAYKEAKYS